MRNDFTVFPDDFGATWLRMEFMFYDIDVKQQLHDHWMLTVHTVKRVAAPLEAVIEESRRTRFRLRRERMEQNSENQKFHLALLK